MARLREIKKRIKAVKNIQRITKTMQMIATAKFQASIRRAQASKPYTQKLSEMVAEIASAAMAGGETGHPLLSAGGKAGRELVLVVTSNRGLCGAYNANILRTANQFIRHRSQQVQLDLEVVGKKGAAFFKFSGHAIGRTHTQFGDKPAYEQVEQLAQQYIDRFVSGELDAVHVVHMQFISNARQTPRLLKLLPLDKPEGPGAKSGGPASVYEFLPSPAELLEQLLPMTVKSQLFQVFMESVVSEQIGRMVAMKAATDNAGKMGRGLRRQFNRARQTQITTELTEIIGGAAALE
jgi:F-type H+-transporting ATPase subunit gamma